VGVQNKEVEMLQQVTRVGETRNAYIILVGKAEGNISLGRPKRRWEYNNENEIQGFQSIAENLLKISRDTPVRGVS
jgi:hypothetical protein